MARLPTARTVQRLATGRASAYQALWRDAFQDARAGVTLQELQEAIRSTAVLQTEQLVMGRWAQYVEQPMRQRLPLLYEDSIGAVMTSADLPQPTRLLLRHPSVQQAIQARVGTEIVGISQTTLRAVRGVLREGWRSGQSPSVIARTLKDHLGLTHRQHQALVTLRTRLQAQGVSASERAVRVRMARDVALRYRAEMIARTESTTAANVGAYETLQVLAQSGQIAAVSTLRRFWIVAGNACEICAPIPSMNPGGVPLEQPFQTPNGPMWYPSVHPQCRCVTQARFAQEG